MEDQSLCRWGATRHLCYRAVPPMAHEDEIRRLVSKHGHAGTYRIILRDEHRPTDHLARHRRHHETLLHPVSEPL